MVIILRLVLILFCILSVSDSVLSQVRDRDFLYRNYERHKYKLNYDEIDGSPYKSDSLIEGIVVRKDEVQTKAPMRLNIFDDEIEYLDGQTIKIINNKNQLDHVLIGSDKIVYKSYNNGKEKGYFIERVSGLYSLFIRYVVEFVEAKAPRTSYDDPVPPTFVRKEPRWYISFNNGPLSLVEFNKSSLEQIFGNHYKDMEAYKKSQKLKFGREEDVIRLFEYFNQLLLKEQE